MEASHASAEGWDLEFVVLPHQLRFGHLVNDRVRHPSIIGGAGLGKTYILVSSSLTLCAINVGLPMMLVEPTLDMVRDILEPAIDECCDYTLAVDADGHIRFDDANKPIMVPRERPIPRRYKAREHAFFFPWWGSKIMCKSGEKPRRLRGPNIAAAGIDEVGDQKEEVLTTLQGRVRHHQAAIRVIMVAGTPRGFNWAYERWAEPGGKRRLKNAALIRAKSTDNVLLTTADPEWIASQKDSYDPELYKQEVEGEFVAIGQVSTYYAFDRTANLRKGLHRVKGPIVVCCDFNHSPLAWTVLQAGSASRCRRCEDEGVPGGRLCGSDDHAWRVIDELSNETSGPATTEQACEDLIKRFGPPPFTTYRVYGSVRMTDRNYSDYEIIRDKLRCTPYTTKRTNVVKDRTNSVNGLLKNAAGLTRLLVDEEKCPMLAKDLEQTRYLPGTFEIDGSNEHRTHWANALSFWAVVEHPVMAGKRGA